MTRRLAYTRWILVLLLVCLTVSLSWAASPDSQESEEAERESILFEVPSVVETAAIHALTLRDAPANVTVITRKQIRNYGYRTLAEALADVPGFYFTSDAAFSFAGVRGFGLPGDLNSRILVMIDGHIMTDSVYGAMYLFGEEFGLDMDLVERIEIVRGPSSALYGSNGVFATVNIIPRSPADMSAARVATTIGSFGHKKATVSTSTYLGRGVNLLLAASGFHSLGRRIEGLGPDRQTVDSVEAEEGYHTLALLTWRNWSFLANFGDRKVIAPTGWYDSDIGDKGTTSRDARNFVEAKWVHALSADSELRWRLYYDQYRYFGRYRWTEEETQWSDNDYALSDWVGSRFSYRINKRRLGDLTIGAQVDADIRNVQVTDIVEPEPERVRYESDPQRHLGVFAQHVLSAGRDLTIYTGLRLDTTRGETSSLSPRFAVVWTPRNDSTYKFMYGRSFRNPSPYEERWEPNPFLEPEKMHTFEVSREQQLKERVRLVTSLYHYRLQGLIEGVPINDYILQYRNGQSSQASGAEAELVGQVSDSLETAIGVNVQTLRLQNATSRPPNSPRATFHFRASVPLFRERLVLSCSNRALTSRYSPDGQNIDPVLLTDVTATTRRLHRNFDFQFGVRNLANVQYVDPLSTEHLAGVMPRAGRTAFFKLIWKGGE